MKKVLGSTKRALGMVLLLESVLYSFVALLVSFLLVSIVIRTSFFNALTERSLNVNLWERPAVLMLFVFVASVCGHRFRIVSGILYFQDPGVEDPERKI